MRQARRLWSMRSVSGAAVDELSRSWWEMDVWGRFDRAGHWRPGTWTLQEQAGQGEAVAALWLEHFRMDKDTFLWLVDRFAHAGARARRRIAGRRALSPRAALLTGPRPPAPARRRLRDRVAKQETSWRFTIEPVKRVAISWLPRGMLARGGARGGCGRRGGLGWLARFDNFETSRKRLGRAAARGDADLRTSHCFKLPPGGNPKRGGLRRLSAPP